MSAINNTLEEIAERIKRAKSAVILTHMRPDGDAIGSALALSRALDVLGIENSVSDESDIPSNLSFLTGTEKIGKGFFKEADLYIAVDSADEQRLGALVDDFRAVSRKKDTVNGGNGGQAPPRLNETHGSNIKIKVSKKWKIVQS